MVASFARVAWSPTSGRETNIRSEKLPTVMSSKSGACSLYSRYGLLGESEFQGEQSLEGECSIEKDMCGLFDFSDKPILKHR